MDCMYKVVHMWQLKVISDEKIFAADNKRQDTLTKSSNLVIPFYMCFDLWKISSNILFWMIQCIKSARIRNYSGPYFPAFGLNTERYGVSLRIQSKCGKIRIRITPNADTFHAVMVLMSKEIQCRLLTKLLAPLNDKKLNILGYNHIRPDHSSNTKC